MWAMSVRGRRLIYAFAAALLVISARPAGAGDPFLTAIDFACYPNRTDIVLQDGTRVGTLHTGDGIAGTPPLCDRVALTVGTFGYVLGIKGVAKLVEFRVANAGREVQFVPSEGERWEGQVDDLRISIVFGKSDDADAMPQSRALAIQFSQRDQIWHATGYIRMVWRQMF